MQHIIDNLAPLQYEKIYAIPDSLSNDPLEEWLLQRGQKVFRGTEHDVLARYYQCAVINKIDVIIRVCADTVLIRASDIKLNLAKFLMENQARMIYGDGSWVFNIDQLEEAFATQPHAESREHVIRSMTNSIDYQEDLSRVENLILNRVYPRIT